MKKRTWRLFEWLHIYREDNTLYMRRLNIFACKWFSIKLHKIVASDYACHHDHPWSFISIILWGGYVEHSGEIDNVTSKIYHPGNILYRPAEFKHKLEIYQPCYTLVFTWKVRRRWGFWTRKGWVHHTQYTSSTTSCE